MNRSTRFMVDTIEDDILVRDSVQQDRHSSQTIKRCRLGQLVVKLHVVSLALYNFRQIERKVKLATDIGGIIGNALNIHDPTAL